MFNLYLDVNIFGVSLKYSNWVAKKKTRIKNREDVVVIITMKLQILIISKINLNQLGSISRTIALSESHRDSFIHRYLWFYPTK